MSATSQSAQLLDPRISTPVLQKIEKAYDSTPWWYDIRGFFILTFTYRCTLPYIIRFFSKNITTNHLEAAVGTGTLFEMELLWRAVKRQPRGRVAAFDYAEPMLAGARHRFRSDPGIHLERADVSALDYEDHSFDSVNVANAVHCFPDVDAGFRELFRVLKPGGKLAMNVLLYPRGPRLFRWISNRINTWGMKKGILETPYTRADIEHRVRVAGFETLEAEVAGNTLNLVARKPLPDIPISMRPFPQEKNTIRPDSQEFSYTTAFSRNIGWVTPSEQGALRKKRVAIAGLGGVGGIQLLTLARLGVGSFHLADLDCFAVENFNRQAGATISTAGKPKVDVMAGMALEINPALNLALFRKGISRKNVDAFLRGIDLLVDALDYFAFDARELVYERCAELGIPVTMAGPIGMGAAMVNFLPGHMSFEDYFQLKGRSAEEKAYRFLAGLTPSALQRNYLADPSAVKLGRGAGPSTAMACQLCAGVAGTEALKILLGRGKVLSAPHAMQFDAYNNRTNRTWRPLGNRNPLQRLLLSYIRHRVQEAA